MEEWRKKALARICDQVDNDVTRHQGYIEGARKAGEIAEKIVMALDREVPLIHVEGIWPRVSFMYANHNEVIAITKATGVKFTKNFKKDFGTMTYGAEIDGISIRIQNVKDVPKCKIIPHKSMEEVTRYEIQCEENGNGGEESKA